MLLNHFACQGIHPPCMVTHAPAGRLVHFQSNWLKITQDRWVLNTIQGYMIDCVTATSTISTPASTILCGADTADLHGDHRTSTEKCNRGSDTPPTTRLLFKSLPCPQERWRTTPGNQPESVEQVCAKRTFQDGGYPHSKGPPETRRLASQSRPEGCLFFSPDRPSTQKVSEVYLQREKREDLPVQLSTFWPVLSSVGVHQNPETSSSCSQGERCKANSLHR